MFGIKRRRTLIRVLSYTISAFCIAVIFAVSGFVMAYKYRMNTEYSYQRALSELSEHVDNIDLALKKSYYASTSSQLVGLTAQIWSDASAANTNISEMPLSTVSLDNTTKYLSQVGDFANSIARQLSQNQKISEAQRSQIKSLSTYSDRLSTELSSLTSELQSGKLHLFKSEQLMNSSNVRQVAANMTLEDGFKNIEQTFSGLPSMIYDGPFSDNVMKKSPVMTKGKTKISAQKAQADAAAFLGIPSGQLKSSGQTAGSLPSYNFSTGSSNIFISKAGGYTIRFLDSYAPQSTKLKPGDALKKAEEFLKKQGIQRMKETYLLTNNNVCTINFSYQKNGVLYYPDMIKIGVAMDSGKIVSFDATGYLMNHKNRDGLTASISEKSVRSLLNPRLKVDRVQLAVIPTGSGGEMLCYEFVCTGENKQQMIDYFSATSGVEEQLLILQTTPGGTLAM